MARLRFPGRPGYRFDRLGVRYGAEEARNVTDPSLAVVARIHRGLLQFRELFGDSDEDEEFEGFTGKDVKLAEKKVAALPEMVAARRKEMEPAEGDDNSVTVGTRMAQAKTSLALLPASERTRNREKTVVRKSYKQMISDGLAIPSKSHVVTSLQELNKTMTYKEKKNVKLPQSLRQDEKGLTKLKNIKIRFKADGKGAKIIRGRGRPSIYSKDLNMLEEIEESDHRTFKSSKHPKALSGSVEPLRKGSHKPKKIVHKPVSKQLDNSRAKHLLAKAKKGPKFVAQSADMLKDPEKHQRKTFVLPTQSSRSSRVIKPNKRFLEDDHVNMFIAKKGKFGDTSLSPCGLTSPLFVNVDSDNSAMWTDVESPALGLRPSTSTGILGLSAETSLGRYPDHKQCLFEQPLIVSGKRQWKPSLKVRMKFGEEEVEEQRDLKSSAKKTDTVHLSDEETSPQGSLSPAFLPTSPFSEPRFGLFSQMGVLGESASGAAQIRGAEAEAKKRSGNSILRRAKLQLNRAALNRSKAALAKKLKADMKKEAKLEQKRLKQFGPLSPLGSVSSLHLHSPPCRPGFESPPVSPRLGFSPPLRSPEGQTTLKSPKPRPRKPVCAVCGNPHLLQRKLYFGVPSCEGCSKFYRGYLLNLQHQEFSCDTNGECDISYKRKVLCSLCRFRKCVSVFPKLPHIRKRDGTTVSLSYDKLNNLLKKGKKDALQARLKAVRDKERLKREKLEERERLKAELKQKRAEERIQKKTEERERRKEEKRRRSDGEKALSDGSPLKSPSSQKKASAVSPLKSGDDTPSVTDSPPENTTPPQADGRGPRIKHVCRKAAVVLGKPIAKFPRASELRLSALPKQEKVKILKKDELEKSAQGSDDELTMEEIISKAGERKDEPSVVKKSPMKALLKGGVKGAVKKVYKAPVSAAGIRRRRVRCLECAGCLAVDCGNCVYCFDKPKFGGNNRMKQSCMKRKCANPRYAKAATKAFIKPKTAAEKVPKGTFAEKASPAPTTCVDSPDSMAPLVQSEARHTPNSGPASTVTSTASGPVSSSKPSCTQTISLYTAAVSDGVGRTGGQAYIPRSSVGGEAYVPHGGDLKQKKPPYFPPYSKLPVKKGGKEKAVTGSRLPTILPAMTSQQRPSAAVKPLRQWSASNAPQHCIKAEFREPYDVDTAWSHGMALITSGPVCVRTVCYLCGSAGNHQMLFCCMCCEPFHQFCLEDDEQPSEENIENWCCRNCQYCHVCGRQDRLLRCDKCENTFHAECLGPNYPTKPSKKKNIWVCTKCVRCKSCGATTPGVATNATWTYDFSLCYECGKLMDRGNFCPICHKCYSDDDWEAKMVQCSACESWVHAKCEGISDERYELLSYMPDDVVYVCGQCSTVRPPPWEVALQEEMSRGLSLVLAALWNSKCANHLLKVQDKPQKESSGADALRAVSSPIDGLVGCDRPADLSQVRDEMFAQYVGENSKCGSTGLSPVEVIDLTSDNIAPVISDKTDTTDQAEDKSSRLSTEVVTEGEITPMDSANENTGDMSSSEKKQDSNEVEELGDAENKQKAVLGSDIKLNTDETKRESNRTGLEVDVSITQSMESVDSTTAVSCDVMIAGCESTSHLEESAEKNNEKENKISTCETQIVYANTQGEKDFSTDLPSSCSNIEQNVTAVCQTSSDKAITGSQELELKGDNVESPCLPSVSQPMEVDQEVPRCEDKQKIDIKHDDSILDSVTKTESEPPKTEDTKLLGGDVKTESSIVASGQGAVKQQLLADKKQLVARFTLQQLQGHLHKTPAKIYPRDLEGIKQKLYDEAYGSVETFNEDMVHLIQTALSDPEMQRSTAKKKANNSVKSIFIKQMEKFFPWFSVHRCSLWEHNKSLPEGMLSDAVIPPSTDHEYAQWLVRPSIPRSPQPSPFKRLPRASDRRTVPLGSLDEGECPPLSVLGPDGEDTRQCVLCTKYGDDKPGDAGRLLYAGQDDWVHINCALWSAEVFEETDGSLQNVHDAWFRGKQLRCAVCSLRGATVGCCTRGCPSNFHFMCARQSNCVFQEDKKVFCRTHRGHIDGKLIVQNKFEVLRRVCVDMDDIRLPKKSWSKGLDQSSVNVLFGACTVESLGELNYLSDRSSSLCPILFTSTRMYWSTVDVHRRCLYTCRIIEIKPVNPLLSPEIVFKEMRIVHDDQHPDFVPVEKLDPFVQSYLEASKARPGQITKTAGCEAREPDVPTSLDGAAAVTDSSYWRSANTEQGLSLSASLDLASSFDSIQHVVDSTESNLSKSWPQQSQKRKDSVNYKLLSPTTLRHLNVDLSKLDEHLSNETVQKSPQKDDELMDLSKVVNRLNNAAAGNMNKKRSSSSTDTASSGDFSPLPSVETNRPGPTVDLYRPPVQALDTGTVLGAETETCDSDDCVITAIKTPDGTEIPVTAPKSSSIDPDSTAAEELIYLELPPGVSLPSGDDGELQLMFVNSEGENLPPENECTDTPVTVVPMEIISNMPEAGISAASLDEISVLPSLAEDESKATGAIIHEEIHVKETIHSSASMRSAPLEAAEGTSPPRTEVMTFPAQVDRNEQTDGGSDKTVSLTNAEHVDQGTIGESPNKMEAPTTSKTDLNAVAGRSCDLQVSNSDVSGSTDSNVTVSTHSCVSVSIPEGKISGKDSIPHVKQRRKSLDKNIFDVLKSCRPDVKESSTHHVDKVITPPKERNIFDMLGYGHDYKSQQNFPLDNYQDSVERSSERNQLAGRNGVFDLVVPPRRRSSDCVLQILEDTLRDRQIGEKKPAKIIRRRHTVEKCSGESMVQLVHPAGPSLIPVLSRGALIGQRLLGEHETQRQRDLAGLHVLMNKTDDFRPLSDVVTCNTVTAGKLTGIRKGPNGLTGCSAECIEQTHNETQSGEQTQNGSSEQTGNGSSEQTGNGSGSSEQTGNNVHNEQTENNAGSSEQTCSRDGPGRTAGTDDVTCEHGFSSTARSEQIVTPNPSSAEEVQSSVTPSGVADRPTDSDSVEGNGNKADIQPERISNERKGTLGENSLSSTTIKLQVDAETILSENQSDEMQVGEQKGQTEAVQTKSEGKPSSEIHKSPFLQNTLLQTLTETKKTAGTMSQPVSIECESTELNCELGDVQVQMEDKETFERCVTDNSNNILIRSRHFSENDCGSIEFNSENLSSCKKKTLSKNSKNSQPLKTYPLRRTARRMCDAAMARAQLEPTPELEDLSSSQSPAMNPKEPVESDEGSSNCSEPPLLKTLGLRKKKGEGLSKHQRSESHPPTSLPLHHMLALKIKAHSLAKSHPGKEGPFKCPICKRLYRTKESYNTHVKNCNFEVSSEEEEDDESKSSQKKEQATPALIPIKRGRGRPPKLNANKGMCNSLYKSHNVDVSSEEEVGIQWKDNRKKKQLSANIVTSITVKRVRGRQSKQSAEVESLKDDHTQNLKYDETNQSKLSEKKDSAARVNNVVPLKRGRGRPPKRKISMDDQESNLPKSAKFPVSSKPGNPLKVAKLSTDSAQGKTSGISTRLSKSPVLTESRSVSPGRRVTRQRRSLSLQSPTLPVQSPSCSVDFPAEPVSSPPGIKRGRGRPPMKRPIKSPPPEPMSEKKKTLNSSPAKTSVKQKIVALYKERSLSKVKSPSKLKKPETITLHDTSSEEEIMLCEITGDLRSKGAVLNPIIQSKVLPDETATGDLKSKDVVLYPVIQPKVLPDETTTGDLRSKAAVLNPVIQPKVVSDEATNDQHINSEQPNKLEKQVQQHEEKPVRSPVKDKEIFSERCGETAPLQKKDSCGSSPEVQGKETLAASPVLEECSVQTVRSPDHLKLTRSLSVPESSSCFKLDKKTDKEENSIDMNTEQNKHEASDNNQVESTINSELSPFPSDSGNTMFMRKSRSGKTEVIVYPKEHYMSSVLPKFAKPPSQQPLCGTTSPNKPSDSPIVVKVHRPGPLEAATGTKVVAVSPPTSKPRSANILEKQKKASENLQKSVVSSISQPASDMRTNPQCIHSKLPAKGPVESRTRKKVTIIRQTTKCINQPISMPHQSPTPAMTGMNIKYMGSFALNPKTAAPVNPADAGMKQVLHVPGQQGTMVGISGPVQTFTPQPLSIQPVSGPVISPINPSAMVHQMLSNQIQSVNQHSAVTANQLVQRVPRQDQVQLSMGNSMAQFIQTPTVLPQTLLSSGQIIQPIGTTCQIIQNSPQPVAAPVQNTFQNPLSSGVLVPISQPLSVTLPQTLQRTFGPTVRFSSPQPITTVAASPMISGLSAQSFSVHSAANLKSVSSQSISGNPSGSLVCNRSGIVSSLSSPLFQMAGPVANFHSVVPGTPCIGSSPRSGLNNPVLGVQPSATTQHTSSSYAVPIRHSELPLTSNSISVSSINHSAESTSPTRPSLSNPNILKILLPDGSPSVASPFISALSKDSALKILQELNNKPASSVVKTCTENVVTVNASQHPKLRNMLKNIEETLNTVTPTVSPAVNPQIAKVTEPAKVSVEPPLRRPSVLSPSAIKQMLQSVPGSMRPPPSPQIMLSKGQHGPNPIQQGPRPKLASHLMVKKIMKNVNKILSKPSILTPKRPPLSWIKPLTQAKSFNFETVVDKNGIKTGFVGKSAVRRKMDTVCREDFSSPEPAKLPAPRRVNRYSRKPKPGPRSGRVTKVQGKTRVSQRPTSEGRLMSHPIIHSQRDMSMLPQPEMEEVVTESPLVAPSSTANDLCPRGKDVQTDKPHLMFEITSEDGETVRASSMEEAWRQVTEKVQDARVSARLKQLSFSSLNGRSMFGVDHPAVVYLTEQLHGARNCHKYKFRYFKHAVPLPDDEPEENASGCIRCEEFDSRKPYDMFSFLMSNYRNKPYLEQQGPGDEEMVLKSSRRPTSMDLPMAMRFRHLQAHAREAVGVYRSVIHGRGLFCKRNIDGGEMVIEYAGEVIRSVLTDKREKYYESKGIGCYMFRIDDMEVVDATVHGSAARFINHSCDPNCYSKVINVDGKKHIVIFAMRPIKKGEELTYDYKFPIEEVKIPCTCGSRRCRKYLN